MAHRRRLPLMSRIAATAIAMALLAATDAAAAVCVENASNQSWLFTAESDLGARASAVLAPDARLCLESLGPGTVAVFAGADELEGCSRRVPGDSITRMLDFPGVDLCAWEALSPG